MECVTRSASRSNRRMAGADLYSKSRVTGMTNDGRSLADLGSAFERLSDAYSAKGGLALNERRETLKAVRGSLIDRREDYAKAIDADFRGRSRHETLITEVSVVVSAIDHTLANLKRWASPKKIRLGFPFWPASAEVRPQPRGVAGIIAPSNYPLQLTLMPLVGALSAGCRALVKPSELTPRTSDLISEHLHDVIDRGAVSVVQGGADIAAALTRLPLDIIQFTGSTHVGRKVASAAAEHMTPTILELGGKSPVVVDESADLGAAAKSIMAGKLINAGQTCVAPDYVFVPRPLKDQFVAQLQEAAGALYPDPANGDYTAIASDRALARLIDLEAGQLCLPLFDRDLPPPYLAPKLVDVATANSPIMKQEIFGPLLPVVAYDELTDVIAAINALPDALATYWFGSPNERLEALIQGTRSGAVSINETVLHAGIHALPFGGVGQSGTGRYHGKAGFDSFSLERVIFRQSRWSLTKLMRPPYGRTAERILEGLMKR
ncbi:MAG: aldehyde dehydrogenase family protein [Bradyrhizobiaceae bacterium]|nr:MAG: aldehyde dehydrogenase family protein [Bradyrhizobiaceae bacterium]